MVAVKSERENTSGRHWYLCVGGKARRNTSDAQCHRALIWMLIYQPKKAAGICLHIKLVTNVLL
jgi:hypothetical protein